MTIRFSILIPAYNREKYIGQAIDSVLSQSFPGYELFVIDDGSTDKTPQILESYGTRIRVLQQPNQGPEVARNKAAALAQGEYLVLLDSDDLLLPNALATYDHIIRELGAPPLIIGAMVDFEDGKGVPVNLQRSIPIKVLKYPDYLSKDIKLSLSSSRIVLKKAIFDEVGGLRNTTATTFHLDSLNLILKVGTFGPCIVVREPSTVAYRHHEANTIRSLDAIAQGILVLARSEHSGQYPGGSKRRRDRYACIGAIALSWAISYCLRGQRWRVAFRLLARTLPMGLAAVWKKILTYLRKPAQAIVLSERMRQPGRVLPKFPFTVREDDGLAE